MKIETLKILINKKLDEVCANGILPETIEIFKDEVFKLIDIYESDCLPDYRRPYVDPSTYFPTAGKEIPCGIPDKVPYSTICSCNSANGGSGICGCIMGNQMIDNPLKYGQTKTNFTTGTYIANNYPPGTTITNTPGITGTITTTN